MNGKWLFVLVIALMGLVMAGCPAEPETAEDPILNLLEPETAEDPKPIIKYPREFWGEWVGIRIDRYVFDPESERCRFYVTSKGFTSSLSRYGEDEATLSKISEHVLNLETYSNAGWPISYYLFANRTPSAQFTGNVVSLSSDSRSVYGTNRSISGLGGIQVALTNLNDATQTSTVKTDANGNFTTQNTIPNDPYRISVGSQSSEAAAPGDGGDIGTITIEAAAPGDGGDIGTITVTDGLNFKVTADYGTDSTRANSDLYVGSDYGIQLKIKNVGTETAEAATYQLSLDDGLTLNSGSPQGILGSIAPGENRSIPLRLTCTSIGGEDDGFKKISVQIHDPLSNKTWKDSASIHFYGRSMSLEASSSSHDANSFPRVSVAIITPHNKTSVIIDYGNVYFPRIKGDYIIAVVSPYQVVYTLRFKDSPEFDKSNFLDTGNYEPNNTENDAALITLDGIISYLHTGDIDYYKLRIE
jgi:hypothetical protein